MQTTLQSIGEEWGLDLNDQELQQYAAFVAECVEGMKKAEGLPSSDPPTDHIRERHWYTPTPEDNKYNAWYVKSDIQQETGGKLAGRRVAIKDSICVAGIPMMVGSELFRDFTPSYDATVVSRLLQQGAIIAGKATCEDLCFSGGSFTSATGPVVNPHDPTKMTGGSSSGCAALLASGEVELAIGGDQGGSIRTPSSWCGVVGLKPTHGLVPYTGALSITAMVDHLGPMTRNVRDCALLLEVIAGRDGFDGRQGYTFDIPKYSEKLTSGVSHMKVGLLQEFFDVCATEVAGVVRQAADRLRAVVSFIEDVSVPYCKHGAALVNAVFWAGAHETLAVNGGLSPLYGGYQDMGMYAHTKKNFRDRLNKLDPTVKMALLVGEYVKRTDGMDRFSHVLNKLGQLRKDIDAALDKYDVLIVPTLPILPQPFPARDGNITEYVKASTTMEQNTGMFDWTGHPALTINAGYVADLPVGMMIVAKHWHEQQVLDIALAWESLRDGKNK